MKKTRIIFLVFPKVHLLDLAGPDQVFHEAVESGAALEVVYCSITAAMSTSSNMGLARFKDFKKVKPVKGDYIFIPGSEVDYLLSNKIKNEATVSNWLKQAHSNGVHICSICTGAFFLAKTGLLNGKSCTTHWKRTTQLKKLFPAIHVIENKLFTEDSGILTSAGVTAGIDMSLHILGKITDDNFSFKIARELVVYIRRQGNEVQQSVFMDFRNHIHSGIHQVQDYIQDNLQKKQSLTLLADIACMSARNLTRVFKKETGITINEYINLIRKELLQKLNNNPDITRKQMADICGLKSERHVIRLLNDAWLPGNA